LPVQALLVGVAGLACSIHSSTSYRGVARDIFSCPAAYNDHKDARPSQAAPPFTIPFTAADLEAA
jgi:hypothetical protein